MEEAILRRDFGREYLMSIGNLDPSYDSIEKIANLLSVDEDVYRPFKKVYESWKENLLND